MTRRELLMATASAALFPSGCVSTPRRENAALAAAMRRYVADRVFGGIVCASNRVDLCFGG